MVLKVRDVLWPTKSFSENDAVTKDWDLWGPLVFCLVLSLLMSFAATEGQSQVVFTGIFTMVWLGEAVCTLNLKLLGGTVYYSAPSSPPTLLSVFSFGVLELIVRSFFQSVCVLGYCLFPLTISALISVLVPKIFVKLPVIVVTYCWSAFGTLALKKQTNGSLGVCVAWKSTRKEKLACYLSFAFVLFRFGVYDPHFELGHISSRSMYRLMNIC